MSSTIHLRVVGIRFEGRAGPLPRPPENLQNREFQVIVPVHYKLEKSS